MAVGFSSSIDGGEDGFVEVIVASVDEVGRRLWCFFMDSSDSVVVEFDDAVFLRMVYLFDADSVG